ncbi:MAG: ATP-binding cassette domain-containing protein [Ruminococcus sp.]|nr:ATP-binding cassette domain-containing protein [Candidatus Apopatosoma intestinale]
MLTLKNIVKNYAAGTETVQALKGLDLSFREHEFVCVLGPSGCGKTTLLNIIGGLDQYSDGDLSINGRSTKDYKDRDWDAYRNHSIGFVFQSYNLIPHQTVLANVELALTLSGVSGKERKERAKKALAEVGLSDQLKKKPAEMSGGQMQRVAIARALVNDPDIILADEPTGALDTETSVQVMEILKRISKDKLIITVTHNPDLADRYATRIVRMLDGKIIGDSNPLTAEETAALTEKDAQALRQRKKKIKLPSMSFATSFSLSLKNLFTKKRRTALTSFAGSIGIIGIALIYAASQGMTTYINTVQEDTLSSYPLTIESTTVDFSSLMQSMIGAAESQKAHEKDAVYSKEALYDLINAVNNMDATENDLKAFKTHIESERAKEDSVLGNALSGVKYSYPLNLLVYTKNIDGEIIASDSTKLMRDMMAEFWGRSASVSASAPSGGVSAGSSTISSLFSSSGTSYSTMWQEMLAGDNGRPISPLLEKQYDLVYGTWPNAYDEIILVLDENNELDDMTLYALGLVPRDRIESIMQASLDGTEIDTNSQSWSYEDICSTDFRVVLNSSCFSYDEATGTYKDLRETEAGLKYLYANALKLKVTGIVRPSEDAVSGMLTGSIGYTEALTHYVITSSENAAAVIAQKADPTLDIFTNLPFRSTAGSLTNKEKEAEMIARFEAFSTKEKAEAFVALMSIPTAEQVQAMLDPILGNMTREDMENGLKNAISEQMSIGEDQINAYLASMSDDDLREMIAGALTEQVKENYKKQVESRMKGMSEDALAAMLDKYLDPSSSLGRFTSEQFGEYYDATVAFSSSTYEDNMKKLGNLDEDTPSSIHLYAATFESKDDIKDAISAYNETVSDTKQIHYTDYVGIIMSSVTTIINAISYVLIGFVAVSLIVSSIMIGVITLISVQERTKEIGILRAIGASKKNVSGLFNAETVIIGFSSGLLGVLITYAVCIPLNLLLHHLTGISNLSAYLPVEVAAILVLISVLLTLISGIIPSRSAAKKDPVVALRTE